MARVITPEGEEYIITISGNAVADAMLFHETVGGVLEVYEIANTAVMIHSADHSWDNTDVLKYGNSVASELLRREYGIIMPVLGTVIIIDLEDFAMRMMG